MGKRPLSVFDPLGGLETAYHVHLRLIRKRVVNFLLLIIDLFALAVTAETENTGWAKKVDHF